MKNLAVPVLMSCNVLKLQPKLSKLEATCNSVQNLCGVAIQETWLDSSVPDGCVDLQGFSVFRSDRVHSRKATGGGVALYIKNEWYSDPKVTLKHSDDNLDFVAVQCGHYIIASVDVNVVRNDAAVLNFLNTFTDTHCDTSVIFLLGDFNRISFRKNFLNPLMKNLVGFPTREGVNLDQVWSNEKRKIICSKLGRLSDHSIVLCQPEFPCKFKQPKSVKRIKVYTVHKEKLSCDLDSTDWELLLQDCTSLEERNDVTTGYIKFCLEAATSVEFIESVNDQFLSNRLIKHAKRRRENCFRNNDSVGFNFWHNKIQCEQNRITTLYLEKLRKTKKSKEYWSQLKVLSGTEKTNDSNLVGIDLDTLNKIFLRFERSPDVDSVRIDPDFVSSPHLSKADVIQLLKRNSNKKSCGIDGIPPWVLKHYAYELCSPVTQLFNECLENLTVPSMWKKVVVTPLPKPSTKSTPLEKRYHPVGNNCSIFKTFEYFLLDQINNFVPDHDETQFVYKKNISFGDAIQTLLTKIRTNLDDKNQCVVRSLFLDYSSAFNTISRAQVLNIINEHSPAWFVYLMKSIFTGIIQFVKNGKNISDSLPCDTGVIQGSVCSPTCFNLITRELTINDDEKLLIKFSDDQCLTFVLRSESDWQKYQETINFLSQWSDKNNLCLNPDKTQEIVFVNKNVCDTRIIELSVRQVSLKGKTILLVSSVKYLGVTIDSDFNFLDHIETVYKRCFSLSYYGTKLLSKTSSLVVIQDFIDVCIIPILTYALPCYVGFLINDAIVLIRRLIRRLAIVSRRDKDEYCHLFVNKLKLACQKFVSKYPVSYNQSEYNLRNTKIVPHFNKAKTQKLITYLFHFNPTFFTDLLNKLI